MRLGGHPLLSPVRPSVCCVLSQPPVILALQVPFTPGGDARLLAEMTKPGGSAAGVQPVLQLAQITNSYSAGNWTYEDPTDGLPGYSGIDAESFNLNGNCTCTDCPCYFPYQAELMNYEVVHIRNVNQTKWWIGIFNNAPSSGPSSMFSLQLR